MPIYKGTQFIERVYKGTEKLRRVHKGNELTYGLYDITYHNKNDLYQPSNGEITEYAWGLTRNIAPENGNTDFDDYFEDYRTHWFGWYDDNTLEIERPKKDNQYIIIPQDKEDLNLFAKWKQKKFSYEGSYTISGTIDNSYTSEGDVIFNSLYDLYTSGIPISYIKNEDGTFKKGWAGGRSNVTNYNNIGSFRQCVWWVAGRSWDIAGQPADGLPRGSLRPNSVWGFRNGNQMFGDTSWPKEGGVGHEGEDLSSKIRPGDILCYGWDGISTSLSDGPGHVQIVEKITDTKIYYSEAGLSITTNSNPARISSRNRSDFVVNKYLYTITYNGNRRRVYFQGIIHNPYVLNSEVTVDNSTESSTTTPFEGDCEDQNAPSIPDMYISGEGIKPEDQEVPGQVPPLAEKGTFWSDLPESWYAENGGWYWKNKGIGGECVWGANGRTAQMRNNVGAGAPWGNGTTDYSDGSVGGNANTWLHNHKGNWSSTLDWTKVQVGDCILYGCTKEVEADDGSGTIPVTSGNHVVVVEEVLGDGKFKVSTWNSSKASWGNHHFEGTYTETHKPGTGADYAWGSVAGYLINHIDKAGGSITHYDYSSTYEYITSERTYDYINDTWGEWEEIDRSDDDWDYDWEE